MCRHVCPVGNLTRLETLTPHGWAQLVALERRGLSSWNPRTVDALYKCADCGNCRAHCVYSNPLPEGIAAARAAVVERGLAPPIVSQLAERLRAWQNPYEPRHPEPSAGTGPVALFVGDDARFLRPATLDAVLAALGAADVEPVLIGRGRNTGFLASSLGLPAIAAELARTNLLELEASGARRLLVLSPGDLFAFTQLYAERLGISLSAGIEVTTVVAYLAERLEAGQLELARVDDATPYAYVEPTHSIRLDACSAPARELLSALLPEAPRELFWRDARAYPAGDLALQFTHPALAEALTRARLEDAAGTGARGVITYGPGTVTQLMRHADAYGLAVLELHELFAERLSRVRPEHVYQVI